MNTTLQPIPELDNRTSDQKEQIHNWLAELGIRETIKKLHDEWGIDVTYNKLQRYRKRHLQKEQLAEHLEHQITMPEYLNLMNGRPVPYDQAGLELIQKRAFELAHQPKISAATLSTLQRVLNYKTARALTERREARADQRLALAEKRLAQNDRRIDLAEKALALRREESEHRRNNQNSKLTTKNSKLADHADQYGPVATNWEEVGQRVCKIFGISPEEEKRRAELHKTWKNPHARPGIPEEINPVYD
jgi:hypothetical protein